MQIKVQIDLLSQRNLQIKMQIDLLSQRNLQIELQTIPHFANRFAEHVTVHIKFYF